MSWWTSCGYKVCTAAKADDVSLQAVRANGCAEAGKVEDDLQLDIALINTFLDGYVHCINKPQSLAACAVRTLLCCCYVPKL